MSFILLACSDIRAQKVNLEFPFASPPPSIQALRSVFEQVFRKEEEAIKEGLGVSDLRPCEPFTINKLQKYDDDSQTWTEITAVDQLQSYDQLYIFRKNSTKADISPQRELPPPRRSTHFSPVMQQASVSPLRVRPSADGRGSPFQNSPTNRASFMPGRGQSPTGANLSQNRPSGGVVSNHPSPADGSYGAYYRERTTPERIEYLFRVGDGQRVGYLNFKGFESIFRSSDIRFPTDVVQDLHGHFARQTGGEMIMSFDDFQRYANEFPVAINVAYQRLTNQEKEEALLNAQRDNARALDQAQRNLQDLENRLAAARQQLNNEDQRKNRLAADMNELHKQRDPEFCHDEQKLLDKEVSVFKYRERLSIEERDYERLAMERRRRNQQQGRPSGDYNPNGSKFDAERFGPRDY
ncbi:calmodulin-like protein containing EF hand [Angomonas deanei]|nr:calmodulin-like protein containing EF hand [Angomonas deanei]|eukprot:EPY40129.1 calmodulin-like protein containing EF hand [Angomonas deanei]